MNLVRDGFNELYFLFSTPGGSVMHGMNIYNVLRALPARLVFHNVGNVDSIGNAIFLAGDIRSEEHTSELQSLMRISYAVFCLKQKKSHNTPTSSCNHNQSS